MGTDKTVHKVGRILTKHPDWKVTFSYLNQATRESVSKTSTQEDTGSKESSKESNSEVSSSPIEPMMTFEEAQISMMVLEEGITQELAGSQIKELKCCHSISPHSFMCTVC